MPNTHSTLTSLFDDIADAIRAKTGGTADIVADDFPSAIAAIPSGGVYPDSKVYGVQWDYSSPSTALTRLTPSNDPNGYVTEEITTEPVPAVGTGPGSSPFDGRMPWTGMTEVNINADGTWYHQGDAGFSRTANDTMVYIPAFYYAITDDAENQRRQFYISDGPHDGFQKHPGSGRYVARYNTGPTFISKSGQAPLANITRAAGREGSRNKGTKWAQYDFATYCAIGLLFTVEFADWDSQSVVGHGITEGYFDAVQTTGLTDSMTYHTGRAAPHTSETGEFACQIQYRHIEGLWGNMYQWVDGINFNNKAAFVCTNPANFADDTDVNYTDAGVTLPSSGFIKGLGVSASAPWALIPSASGGSASTYIPDRVRPSTGWRVLYVGGAFDLGSHAGLFQFFAYYASSDVYATIGSRLLYVP